MRPRRVERSVSRTNANSSSGAPSEEVAVANDTALVRADVITSVGQSTVDKGPFADLPEATMHLDMEQLGVRPCRVSVVFDTHTMTEPHYRIKLIGAIVD
jgi:hypothetical protein